MWRSNTINEAYVSRFINLIEQNNDLKSVDFWQNSLIRVIFIFKSRNTQNANEFLIQSYAQT